MNGVAFPFGHPYAPAGIGNAIIYDPGHQVVRRLTTSECWDVLGGGPELYDSLGEKKRQTALLGSSPYAICLYAGSAACGLLAATHTRENYCDATRTGQCQDRHITPQSSARQEGVEQDSTHCLQNKFRERSFVSV